MDEKSTFVSTMSTLWAKATALITGWRKWDSPSILLWILMVIAILGFLWFAWHVPRPTSTPKAPQEAGAAAYPTFLPPPTEQASDLKLYIYELMHSALGKVEEQKRAAVEEHRDALTRFSDLTFWYAAFITALSAFFLMVLLGTIWKTKMDWEQQKAEADKLSEEAKKKLAEVIEVIEEERAKQKKEADKKLQEMDEKLASVTVLAQYSNIIIAYYLSKRAPVLGSRDTTEHVQPPADARKQKTGPAKYLLHNTLAENPGRWDRHAGMLRTAIWDILLDNTEDSLKTGGELYDLFNQLPEKEKATYEGEQALSQASFVRFFAQQKKFDEAQENFRTLETDFGKQHEAIARASVSMVAAYGDANRPEEARAVFDAMKDLGDTEVIREERAKASFNMIIDYGNANNLPEARAVFDAMKDLGDTEAIRELRAGASVNMISAYSNADKPEEARAVFDAIKDLGDTEAIREERAEASVNMIGLYGKAGRPEEARAVFDAMKALGDTEAIRGWRAKAAGDMIGAYGKAGKPEEAQAVFDAIKDLGDTEAIREARARASVNMISAYGGANKPEEARAVFDAMEELGDFSGRQEVFAQAGAKLIVAYTGAKRAKQEDKERDQEAALAVYNAIKHIVAEGEALEWRQKAEESLREKGWL